MIIRVLHLQLWLRQLLVRRQVRLRLMVVVLLMLAMTMMRVSAGARRRRAHSRIYPGHKTSGVHVGRPDARPVRRR